MKSPKFPLSRPARTAAPSPKPSTFGSARAEIFQSRLRQLSSDRRKLAAGEASAPDRSVRDLLRQRGERTAQKIGHVQQQLKDLEHE